MNYQQDFQYIKAVIERNYIDVLTIFSGQSIPNLKYQYGTKMK